jgi:glycosyltransferase involved in cell wall biosynthesis
MGVNRECDIVRADDRNSMDLSVIIPTWNRARLLQGTLDALAAQQVDGSLAWEIVVVDNDSRDETERVVAAFAKRTATPVRYVVERQPGASNARNRGLLEARGAILAFTDDDVLPAPDWIAAMVAAIERWKTDGVGGRILPRWEVPPPTWLTRSEVLLSRLAIMADERSGFVAIGQTRPQVWGPNMAFRRAVFDRVGGFDPHRGVVHEKLFRDEETDLISRALERELKIAYDPTITVFHRIGPDRMRKSYFRKLFFDAGQCRALVTPITGERSFLGAPLRLYALPLSVLKWVGLVLLGRPSAFHQQLGCFWQSGKLAGYWTRWRRGASEAAGS